MSNLATMIMEGSMNGYSRANLTHTYGHEDGAGLIAMESAEALRDIFEAEFYVPNTCTIQATLEGAYSVEESSQAAIMEASIKGAFAKIKEFFIKLKDKVKEFLHNVKRYLLGIFGNDEKWVKTYEKELLALKSTDLKDYEIKLYNYDFNKPVKYIEEDANTDAMLAATKVAVTAAFYKHNEDKEEIDESDYDDNTEQAIEKVLSRINADSEEDVDKAWWSAFRSGADNEADKEDVKVAPNIRSYIDTIKKASSELSKIDSLGNKIDNNYKKAIKLVDDAEKKISNSSEKGDQREIKVARADIYDTDTSQNNSMNTSATKAGQANAATALRKFSAYMSKVQTIMNKGVTAYKSALTERNKAYKKALTGAFAYARKNKKKD